MKRREQYARLNVQCAFAVEATDVCHCYLPIQWNDRTLFVIANNRWMNGVRRARVDSFSNRSHRSAHRGYVERIILSFPRNFDRIWGWLCRDQSNEHVCHSIEKGWNARLSRQSRSSFSIVSVWGFALRFLSMNYSSARMLAIARSDYCCYCLYCNDRTSVWLRVTSHSPDVDWTFETKFDRQRMVKEAEQEN